MKTISNDKMIKRNGRIGNITSLASIVILGVGMFFSFKDTDGTYLTLTFSCLIVGFLMFQVGNYYMNKFGKPPRPDQTISTALKGLDDKYTLYHYMTPVSHLLLGPSGIFCLLPYNQPGSISYNETRKRWKQSGGNFFLKTFGGENLGRPDVDANYAVSDIARFLAKKNVDLGNVTPESIIVFTSSKATVNTEGYPGSAVTAEKLKEFIRKQAKATVIPAEMLSDIQNKINPPK